MRISPHMVRVFNPGSRGAQVLREIDRIVSLENPKGLWLEWVPASIIPKSDGFHIRKVENGNEGNWEVTMSVSGELRYIVGLGGISENAVSQIREVLKQRLKRKKEKPMKKEEKLAVLQADSAAPPADPAINIAPTAGKPETRCFGVEAQNLELVLMALEDIVKRENSEPVDGWYEINRFSNKILAIVANFVEIKKTDSARTTLHRILEKLQKNGEIEIQKKDLSRSIHVRFAKKSEAKETASASKSAPAIVAPASNPPPKPVVQPAQDPSSQVLSVIAALKDLRFVDGMKLKEELKKDPELETIIRNLLS